MEVPLWMKLSVLGRKKPKVKQRAFVIMEVIVSIIIVTVVGIALMGSSSTYTKLFGHIEKNSFDFETLSLIGINANKEYSGTTKNLDDILAKVFFIQNDKIIDHLKSIDFSYQEKEPSSLAPTRQTDPMEWRKEVKETSNLQFGVIRIGVGGEKVSGTLYTIREIKP